MLYFVKQIHPKVPSKKCLFLQISTKLHFFGGKSASKVRKFGRKSVVWMIVRRQIKLAVVKKLAGQFARRIRLS